MNLQRMLRGAAVAGGCLGSGLVVLPAPVVSLRVQTSTVQVQTEQEPGAEPQRAIVEQALRDLAAQRYDAAFASLRGELQRCGARAPEQLRLDAALAALRLQRSRDAELLLAGIADDGPFAADRLLLLGHAAWLDAERAVAAARLPDAEPMAWTMAVRSITRAEVAFQSAAEQRPEFAIAVRNCERAQLRRREIEREREAAKSPDSKREDAPQPEVKPKPPDDPSQQSEPSPAEVNAARLSAEDLSRLQQLLRSRQQQKVRVRQEAVPPAAGGARGW